VRRALLAFAFLLALPLHAQPERVVIGVYVTGLYDFNPGENCYTVSFWVWTRHHSPQLHPLETVVVENAKSVTTTKSLQTVKNGEIWTQRFVIAVIRYDWQLHAYPFDSHRLPLVLEEGQYDTSQLTYVADAAETKVDRESTEDGWEVDDFRFVARDRQYPTTFGDPALTNHTSSRFAQFRADILVRRTEIGIFIKLLLGAYVAFFLTMLTFRLKMDQPTFFSMRLSVLVGSLFAVLVNLRATEAVLGRTADFTLVDKIHLAIAFYILIAAIAAFLSRRIAERKEGLPQSIRFDGIGMWLFGVTFVLINVILIVLAVRAGAGR